MLLKRFFFKYIAALSLNILIGPELFLFFLLVAFFNCFSILTVFFISLLLIFSIDPASIGSF